MSALRVNRQWFSRIGDLRNFSSVLPNESEYTSSPQYPKILDMSPKKIKERKNQNEDERIKAVKTVEEKQIKLNMPRYFGFKCNLLTEDHIPYDNLEMVQHVTRTHLIKSSKLPTFYEGIDTSNVITSIKKELEDAILFELDGYKRIHDLTEQNLDKVESENVVGDALSKQFNRILLNHMSPKYSHLENVWVDFNSRIESFWYAGGMTPLNAAKHNKLIYEEEIKNRAMNYIGSATVALRSEKPLLPILPLTECENPIFTVPSFTLDPRTVGAKTGHRFIANIPGFWPGDSHEFGLLSYHKRGHHLIRHYNDAEDNKEALYRQGILASFSWLYSQANFLGFNTFNDITFPLVTQSIITNGKKWSFFVYQLNTIINHSKYVHENPKRNLCWSIPEMKLFEQIDNGKLSGLNDEVFEILTKFYANTPEMRLGVNMKPNLSHEEKLSADYVDDEKREWLEREYKFLVSNRPRKHLPDEIYSWEKIYKIDHNTRFMDKKLRPFELGQKPFRRRLDERKPRYIPRVLRPDLPRWKGRNANEYFP